MSCSPSNHDLSNPRKSSRVRQKKQFGDDFLDPLTAIPSDSISEPAAPRRKSIANRKGSMSPLENSSTDSSVSMYETNVFDGNPMPSFDVSTTTNSSMILKLIADSVTNNLVNNVEDVKNDTATQPESVPNRKFVENTTVCNLSTVKHNSSVVDEMDDDIFETESPDYQMQPSSSDQDHRYSGHRYNRPNFPYKPTLNAKQRHEYNKYFEERALEEERNLSEATNRKLKDIRAATVRKIIQNRTNGKVPHDRQMKAQNEEILNYVSTTSDTTVLKQLPDLSEREIEIPPKQQNEPIKPPLVFKLPVRRMPVASARMTPYPIRSPNIPPLADVSTARNLHARPDLHVAQCVRLQAENKRKPQRPNPRPTPSEAIGPNGHLVRLFHANTPQSSNQQAINPGLYDNRHSPRLPVKVLSREEVAQRHFQTNLTNPNRNTSTRFSINEPKIDLERWTPNEPKQDGQLMRDPKREMIEGNHRKWEHYYSSELTRIPFPKFASTSPVPDEQQHMEPQPLPEQKKVTRIMVSRGPDGKMVPIGKVLIKNTQATQYRKAMLAPLEGHEPPRLPIRHTPHEPERTTLIPANYSLVPVSINDQECSGKKVSVAEAAKFIVNFAKQMPSINETNSGKWEESESGNVVVKEELPDDYVYAEVKKEMIDIKNEPFDDYEPTGEADTYNDNPHLFSAVQQQPHQNMSRIAPDSTRPFATHQIDHAALYDLMTRRRKGSSPQRIFLGAEEPMKDIVPELVTYGTFHVRKVKSLNKEKFYAARRRTPSPDANDLGFSTGRKPATEVVCEIKTSEQTVTPEEREEERINRKKKHDEYIRQQKAMAQKFTLNETKVWSLMQSDEFKDSFYQDHQISRFADTVGKPNALVQLPEYSDSLSNTKPELFRNLLSIYRDKVVKNCTGLRSDRMRNLVLREAHMPKDPIPVQIPQKRQVIIKPEIEDERMKLLAPGLTKMVEVNWEGNKVKIPECATCHLCKYLMRLCIRRAMYRGEMRTYPAYRCLRKNCQTFRCIKKQLEMTKFETGGYDPTEEINQITPGSPMYLEPCNESIDDEEHMEEKVDVTAEKMPSATDSVEVEESNEFRNRSRSRSISHFDDMLLEEDEDVGVTVSYKYLKQKHDGIDLDDSLSAFEDDDDDHDVDDEFENFNVDVDESDNDEAESHSVGKIVEEVSKNLEGVHEEEYDVKEDSQIEKETVTSLPVEVETLTKNEDSEEPVKFEVRRSSRHKSQFAAALPVEKLSDVVVKEKKAIAEEKVKEETSDAKVDSQVKKETVTVVPVKAEAKIKNPSTEEPAKFEVRRSNRNRKQSQPAADLLVEEIVVKVEEAVVKVEPSSISPIVRRSTRLSLPTKRTAEEPATNTPRPKK